MTNCENNSTSITLCTVAYRCDYSIITIADAGDAAAAVDAMTIITTSVVVTTQ